LKHIAALVADRMKENETADELRRRAEARLHPRLTDANCLILRNRREIFARWLTRVPGNRLAVLDVGGSLQPYRPLFESRLARYVALDLRSNSLIDVRGRAEQLPLADAIFDVVLCTQVLEYVANPALAVGEIHRVLKRDGVLLLSVPTIFPRDSEEDCWRFEPAALREILGAFSRVEVEPEGGSVAGFVRLAAIFLISCTKLEPVKRLLSYSAVPVLNLFAGWLEGLGLSQNDQFAGNYSAFAQK